MTPYHGTPSGGKRLDSAQWLMGRHALVPFPRQDDMGIVAEVCKSFVFDNGAFSVWKRGEVMDVPGYIAWCDKWHRHPGFDWALIPDVIMGSETENDALLADWPRHIEGVPVWHLHESLTRLDQLVSEWRTVAFGSSGQWATPGTSDWWSRIAEAMDVACDELGRPRARLHGLRMLDPKIFTNLPFASADSTNAAMNSGSKDRFGMYVPATTGQCAAVIADRIEINQSAATWDRSLAPIQQGLGLFELVTA